MVKAQVNGSNYNLGDYIFGQPAEPTNGMSKYSYRELLLCNHYSIGSNSGIACLYTHTGLATGYWGSSRPRLVKLKLLNIKRQ